MHGMMWHNTGCLAIRVRQRMHQLNCEILESRQLLSTLDVVNSSRRATGTENSARPREWLRLTVVMPLTGGVAGTITLTYGETALMNRNCAITHVRQETRRARSLLHSVPGHFLRPSDNAAPRLAETSGKFG